MMNTKGWKYVDIQPLCVKYELSINHYGYGSPKKMGSMKAICFMNNQYLAERQKSVDAFGAK